MITMMRTWRTDGPYRARTATGTNQAWQSSRTLRSKEARCSCLPCHARRPRNTNVSPRAPMSSQPFQAQRSLWYTYICVCICMCLYVYVHTYACMSVYVWCVCVCV